MQEHCALDAISFIHLEICHFCLEHYVKIDVLYVEYNYFGIIWIHKLEESN
jgi:hypothetical protein